MPLPPSPLATSRSCLFCPLLWLLVVLAFSTILVVLAFTALSYGYWSSFPLPPFPIASSCPCLLRPLFLLLVVLACLFHPLILKSLLPSRPPIQVVPSLQPLLQTTSMITSLPPSRTILHCKKRFLIFLSPAGMSLTKLSLAGNN